MVLVLGFSTAGPAGAQTPLSLGCNALNSPFFDGFYRQSTTSSAFNINEQVTITAGFPSDGTPVAIELEIPQGVIVDTDGFPGTLSYTFPANISTSVSWENPGIELVTWAVSCGRAPGYPLALNTPMPAASSVQAPAPEVAAISTFSGFSVGSLAPLAGLVALNVVVVGALWRRRRLPQG